MHSRVTTWDSFCKRAHEDANLDQTRELAKTADAETLREVVNQLCNDLAAARFAARVKQDTNDMLWRRDRG